MDHLPQNPAILVSSVDMLLLDGIKNNINYNYYEDHSIEQRSTDADDRLRRIPD